VTRILITGGRGFLGRNLAAHLRTRNDCETLIFDQDDSPAGLENWLGVADVVFHLAGVNRPKDEREFERGNAGLTERICTLLRQARRQPKIVFASSIQAELQNPYGISKRKAELALQAFAATTGASVSIYRLKNLFGKWCRPNYNSVTATFCHNFANDLPITISDPDHEVELSYVDDVVAAFLEELETGPHAGEARTGIPSYRIRLGDLAGRIQAFHDMRTSLMVPDLSDRFNRALYATYLSYVPKQSLQEDLRIRSDARGCLAEFIKSKHFGQIFVSRTKPGVTRGNHYHHTKAEKFFVVEGDGLIRMRAVESGAVQEYEVHGHEYQVIDIPPGFTHSITNVGAGELVTLFWSSEVFDPDRPDTYYLPVDEGACHVAGQAAGQAGVCQSDLDAGLRGAGR
jgi:UDP-2-acetamido-2,6-beta-L-arabino-hexul-4-ose reductase